ncbi:MAG: T9SS type A sorting domain-containing protein, partial [Balneolales bacterium]
QCSLSRIWGGIHPPIDDIHGRLIGEKVGINAFEQAEKYFAGTVPKPDESPVSWKLEQNYPNPFNLHTTISFYIREQSKILLKVYDITGREVATVVSQTVAGGNHTRHWNASGLASGVYIYRLEAQPVSGQAKRYVETRKATLIK